MRSNCTLSLLSEKFPGFDARCQMVQDLRRHTQQTRVPHDIFAASAVRSQHQQFLHSALASSHSSSRLLQYSRLGWKKQGPFGSVHGPSKNAQHIFPAGIAGTGAAIGVARTVDAPYSEAALWLICSSRPPKSASRPKSVRISSARNVVH